MDREGLGFRTWNDEWWVMDSSVAGGGDIGAVWVCARLMCRFDECGVGGYILKLCVALSRTFNKINVTGWMCLRCRSFYKSSRRSTLCKSAPKSRKLYSHPSHRVCRSW